MSRYFLQNTKLAAFEREMMEVPGFGRRRMQSENHNGIKKPANRPIARMNDALKLPLKEYRYPDNAGTFVGILIKKKKNGRGGLDCFFDSSDGRKLKLSARDCGVSGFTYKPDYSDIDISGIPYGTSMRVTYRLSRTGKTQWLEAEIL